MQSSHFIGSNFNSLNRAPSDLIELDLELPTQNMMLSQRNIPQIYLIYPIRSTSQFFLDNEVLFPVTVLSFCSAISTQIGQGQLPHDAAISVLVMGDVAGEHWRSLPQLAFVWALCCLCEQCDAKRRCRRTQRNVVRTSRCLVSSGETGQRISMFLQCIYWIYIVISNVFCEKILVNV